MSERKHTVKRPVNLLHGPITQTFWNPGIIPEACTLSMKNFADLLALGGFKKIVPTH